VNPLVIAVAGDPVPRVRTAHGPFAQHVRETVGAAWTGPWLTVDVRTESLPPADRVAAVIVTGSHASVTELAPWMNITAAWLREAVVAGRPVLGLCFGHQLLGYAMGGTVERLPGGPETGTVLLDLLAADDLTGPVPAVPPYVNMMHEDSVTRLPPGAILLARTAREPHAAVRFGPRAWGVQFHPEFDGAIVRSYLVAMGDRLRLTDAELERRLAQAADTPWSAGLLRGFAALASGA
jgi:GMP synthase (glutamine-hydrolysing)